ncbi:hypothetical protein BCR33DRAFT_716428 [Rhizoclosmatium globosum]|uniref:F-box domain-containing protein n=1 Tax=Rhizoclosmatium globosum TaxID=329046 RepID=A0A1Y2CDT6_9FUNG|nr:hypothetical protein BCR33DRAFT_716428 [Rhizoclosmatium globosum]|eukprot:ORY45086.1 hypothetical protein BCR33DRAFT_716428 [Rhizoclosmatium globosum]
MMDAPSTSLVTIYSLPTEIREEILIHLPIDSRLKQVALVSKALFTQSLLFSPEFARKHLALDKARTPKADCIWSYLSLSNMIKDNTLVSELSPNQSWLKLPFFYKLNILRCQLESKNCANHTVLRRIGRSSCGSDSSTLLSTLIKDASFDPTCRSNRALLWTCMNDDVNSVRILLADPRVDPGGNHKAFLAACANSSVNTIKLMLTDPRIDPTFESNGALSLACRTATVETVQLLLEDSRIDPTINTNLFRIAVEQRDGCLVDLLLRDGRCDPAKQNNQALLVASQTNNEVVVSMLLKDPRVDPMDGECAALREAARNGLLEVVQILLADPRVDPGSFDNIVLRNALELIDEDLAGYTVLKLLLQDSRVDPTSRNSEVVRNMVRGGHLKSVALLLKDGRADPSAMENAALKLAIDGIDVEMLRVLLSDDRVDPLGGQVSAVETALTSGNVEMIQAIMADRRVMNRSRGYSLILEYYEAGKLDLVTRLIKFHGIEIVGWNPISLLDYCVSFETSGSFPNRIEEPVANVIEEGLNMLKSWNVDLLKDRSKAFRLLLINWKSIATRLENAHQ